MKRKHGILLFLASCIPGCGEMYQGYMKRGVSILTAFCGLFALAVFLEIGALAVLMLPLWLFSFFDSYNLRAQTDEEAAAHPDAYLFGLDGMDTERMSALCAKRHSLLGWGLVALGTWVFYATVVDWVMDFLCQFFEAAWWLRDILVNGVPRLAVTVGIIALGVWFIRGPKRPPAEDIPVFTPPAEPEAEAAQPAEGPAEPEVDHGEQ